MTRDLPQLPWFAARIIVGRKLEESHRAAPTPADAARAAAVLERFELETAIQTVMRVARARGEIGGLELPDLRASRT